jgi:hypothetical protein
MEQKLRVDSPPDALLERNARVAQLPAPMRRHTTSLSNWLSNTGGICRKETAFLQEEDLCTVAGHADDGLSRIETLVELVLVFFLSRLGIVRYSPCHLLIM